MQTHTCITNGQKYMNTAKPVLFPCSLFSFFAGQKTWNFNDSILHWP